MPLALAPHPSQAPPCLSTEPAGQPAWASRGIGVRLGRLRSAVLLRMLPHILSVFSNETSTNIPTGATVETQPTTAT